LYLFISHDKPQKASKGMVKEERTWSYSIVTYSSKEIGLGYLYMIMDGKTFEISLSFSFITK
jgi:hypothetical protein